MPEHQDAGELRAAGERRRDPRLGAPVRAQAQWDDPPDSGRNIDWTRRVFERMQPFLESGVYANNLGEEDGNRVASAYGPNYGRLAQIKSAWDPDNLFRLNHNIAPVSPT